MTLGLGGTWRLGTRTHTRECTRVPSFREFPRHTGRRSEGEKKKRRAKAGCSRRIVPRSMVRNAPRPFARANVSPRHPAVALPSSISARLVARNRVYVFALALVLTLMLTTRTCTHGGPCATNSAPDHWFLPLRLYTAPPSTFPRVPCYELRAFLWSCSKVWTSKRVSPFSPFLLEQPADSSRFPSSIYGEWPRRTLRDGD